MLESLVLGVESQYSAVVSLVLVLVLVVLVLVLAPLRVLALLRPLSLDGDGHLGAELEDGSVLPRTVNGGLPGGAPKTWSQLSQGT